MPKGHIVIGLDIGTSVIKVLVAGKKEEVARKATEDSGQEELEVLSLIEERSVGVRKGVVFNVDSVAEISKIALARAEEESGHKIDSVYVNVGGSHIFSTFSHGLVSVSRADRKIPQEDVERVLQAAQMASMIPSNKEIIKAMPKEFTVDGAKGLKEVAGMEGLRLEADVLSVGVFSPYLKNLTYAVTNADVQINDVIPSAMAAARAVLKAREKELGVVLVEIGAGTTGIAVYQEGDLVYTTVLPIGSAHITNDIAAGLKIDPELAEKIKIEFGSCVHRGSDKKEKIKMEEGEETLTFSRKQLAGIIGIRVYEIFDEVGKELKKLPKEVSFPSGVVLTGGGAKLPRILELARKELKVYCRLGRPFCFSPALEDISLATVCGLVLNGFDLEDEEEGGGIELPFAKGVGSQLKKIFRIFVP